MKPSMLLLTFLSLLAAPSFLLAVELSENQKLSDLNQLVYTMESGYGPLKYKATKGMDIATLKAKYAEKAKSTKSNAEFYYLIKQFISEFHDSHFRAAIPSDVVAEIPVMTDLVEGKILIDTIDRNELAEKDFPFSKGDEVVTINGKSAPEYLKEMASYLGSGYQLTELRRAAQTVFFRPAAAVPVPNEKTLKVTIRRGLTSSIEAAELTWKVKGNPLDEKFPFIGTRFSRPFWDLSIPNDFAGSTRAEKSYKCSGNTRIAVPQNAIKIIEEPFVAYYHPTPIGNVGYLRIPHYYWRKEGSSDLENKDYEEKVFSQYEYAIKKLEENTVGLIIDQDHNCGGSVFWLEKLASLFMDKPFKPLQFRFLASKSQLLEIMTWEKEVAKNSLEAEAFKEVLDLVKTDWQNGEFLTTKQTSFRGSQYVNPSYTHYTKPIVMLIDEMSGSGGDAFPSMMKGFGRAKLVGTRTIGAGGHVVPAPALNYSGITVEMTKSLFYRPDGVEVENNGAVPDFAYSPTREDFMYEYRNYQKFYLEKLAEVIAAK
ncbi:MAG: hypothetical protein A4S09_05500 [Proteobacteria bacterium SG_bin7]|nr:MAG: hypothetical protein A4S09_05500 [Proteobacteria bacterium SG_bin7]